MGDVTCFGPRFQVELSWLAILTLLYVSESEFILQVGELSGGSVHVNHSRKLVRL